VTQRDVAVVPGVASAIDDLRTHDEDVVRRRGRRTRLCGAGNTGRQREREDRESEVLVARSHGSKYGQCPRRSSVRVVAESGGYRGGNPGCHMLITLRLRA